ncbi:MAG: DNA-binding protein [Flavobacterium sp.]|nr:MAG: DNA-binding protein [Flavobacterium sp.]
MEPLILLTEEQLLNLLKKALRSVLQEGALNHAPQPSTGPLTLKEASLYLNLSPSTLYRYTSQRLIPHHKPGKILYFLREDLDHWLQQNRQLTQEQVLCGEMDGILTALQKSKRLKKS